MNVQCHRFPIWPTLNGREGGAEGGQRALRLTPTPPPPSSVRYPFFRVSFHIFAGVLAPAPPQENQGTEQPTPLCPRLGAGGGAVPLPRRRGQGGRKPRHPTRRTWTADIGGKKSAPMPKSVRYPIGRVRFDGGVRTQAQGVPPRNVRFHNSSGSCTTLIPRLNHARINTLPQRNIYVHNSFGC